MAVANTIAYYDTATITAVKSFKGPWPGQVRKMILHSDIEMIIFVSLCPRRPRLLLSPTFLAANFANIHEP